MINRALLKKAVGEAKWLLAGCSVVIFAFCWLRVWLVSRLDTSRYEGILDMLPDDWKQFSPVDIEWMVTYAGRISLTFDEPIVVFGVSIWAIARGSDCVSGEVGRGTMEMLLSQPVSRLQVMFTQAFVTVAGVAVLAAASWLGIWCGLLTNTVDEEIPAAIELPFGFLGIESVPIPFAEPEIRTTQLAQLVDVGLFAPGAYNLFALGVFLAAFSTMASAWDRYRWRTIGLVVSLYVIEIIVKIIGRGIDTLSWLTYGSVFSAYEPQRMVKIADETPAEQWNLLLYGPQQELQGLGPLGYYLVLIVLGIACYAAAAVVFSRRDLPAPL